MKVSIVSPYDIVDSMSYMSQMHHAQTRQSSGFVVVSKSAAYIAIS